jgi:ATP-dependent 26S proteasome regulatory subunit
MKKLAKTFINNVRTNTDGIDSAKSLVTDVAKVLRHTKSDKATKVINLFNAAVTTYSTGLLAVDAFNLIRTLITEHEPVYSFEINENDMLFPVITGMVNNVARTGYQPVIEMKSRTLDQYSDTRKELAIYKDHLIGGEVMRFENGKAFVYSVNGIQEPSIIEIAGHKVTVVIKKPTKMHLVNGYYDDSAKVGKSYSSTTAIVTCDSDKARNEVMLCLRNNLKMIGKRKVTLFLGRSWGSFSASTEAPDRDISTVILKNGQLENIINELTTFMNNEDKYNDLGVPYHHGILLSGPPGTGKSSTAKTVASHLGLDTYYISLSGVKNNDTFNELISDIKPRSVLLLEDIDTIQAAKNRDKKGKEGINMDDLLNVLDGVLSPHGVITIATTNNIDKLDDAIIRPGRIDTIYEVDYLDNVQFKRICEQFIGKEINTLPDITGLNLSPAEVIGEIKKHITDNDAAFNAVIEYIAKKIEKESENEEYISSKT